jgi:hypothetical protein
MIRAVIRQFGFFQISVFFDPRNVLGENLKQMNAGGLMNFFSHTEPMEILSVQSVRFCTVLSES